LNATNDAPTVTYADVEAAARRLAGVAHRTPVLRSKSADRRTGGSVYFKCENLQRTGAFKFRGAYNALSQLDADARATGVLTYSSGNHAQAIALAGQLLGIHTRVIMPSDAPPVKLDATRGYGAEVILYDREETTRELLAKEYSTRLGVPVIPPYDHPHIVAGQGTAAAELFKTVEKLDLLLVCCGGGGLLSGSAISAKHLCPSCRVVGVEPVLADDATRSFHTRTLHSVHNPATLADGARTPSLGQITFPLVLRYVDDMVTVSEAAIAEATLFMMERMKMVVEPTGALAFAALIEGCVSATNKNVGVIVSGGNIDLRSLPALFSALS
jgi:threonine dehydratase